MPQGVLLGVPHPYRFVVRITVSMIVDNYFTDQFLSVHMFILWEYFISTADHIFIIVLSLIFFCLSVALLAFAASSTFQAGKAELLGLIAGLRPVAITFRETISIGISLATSVDDLELVMLQ